MPQVERFFISSRLVDKPQRPRSTVTIGQIIIIACATLPGFVDQTLVEFLIIHSYNVVMIPEVFPQYMHYLPKYFFDTDIEATPSQKPITSEVKE